MKYLTKENITFILAVIGSVGTIYTLLITFFRQRIKINISIIEHSFTKDSALVYMMFTNASHLPVSVTNICIWNKGTIYSCVSSPEIVKFHIHRVNNEEVYREAIMSIPLPINLPSLSGTSGYLYFLIPQENFECDANSLTVELSTNRHGKLQKTLSLTQSLRIAP